MTSGYSTRPLSADQIDLSYLLVEVSGCSVERSDWSAFCRRVIERRGAAGLQDDVIVASDADGHVRGLFVTELIQSRLFGRVLDVPMFITASAGDEDGIILDLLDAARTRARQANCRDIRIWTQGSESWLRVTADTPLTSVYKGIQLRIA